MKDTSATYQQLQQIIRKAGCPICALSEGAVKRYLDTLLWESSTDLNLHAMLVNSIGFCGRHSRQLLTFGGQRLAAAVVERATLLAAIHRLPELAAIDARASAPRCFSFGPSWIAPKELPTAAAFHAAVQLCPACVRQTAEEARGIELLLKHLDEFATPLRNAGGLCLPHFVQATRAADSTKKATLLAVEQKVLTELVAELEEFIRKHMDHHHNDPISDRARLAVERTISALTGEYPVR